MKKFDGIYVSKVTGGRGPYFNGKLTPFLTRTIFNECIKLYVKREHRFTSSGIEFRCVLPSHLIEWGNN